MKLTSRIRMLHKDLPKAHTAPDKTDNARMKDEGGRIRAEQRTMNDE